MENCAKFHESAWENHQIPTAHRGLPFTMLQISENIIILTKYDKFIHL